MAEKLNNVVASPISGVYKAPLTVELDCPDVSVAPTSVATSLYYDEHYFSRNISKVGNNLFFSASEYEGRSSGLLGIYNINNNTITTLPCPYSTSFASFIYVNGCVYIMGGQYGNNKIMKYNEGVVTVLEQNLPKEIMMMTCNAIGQYIYMMGGIDTSGSYDVLDTIYRLDTTTDTIELMPYKLKEACYHSSSAVYQNRYIYVLGGHEAEKKVQIIDTEEGTVSLSKDLPVEMNGSGAMIKDDFLYVFGGYNSYGSYSSGDINTVYKKYLLDDSDWVLDTQTLAYSRGYFGYTSDEKGYYHIIGGYHPEGRYYETGRFGLLEIRYTQTDDGTTPPDPTETDTLYNAPIELSSVGQHNIKAKAFKKGATSSTDFNSDIVKYRYYVTDKTIIELDYTEDLPEELYLSQFNSALKQYISFYSGVYVVDDSNVNVVIENDTETTKKVIFYVAYEEGENAYSGYFEKIINIKEVINTMANFNNLGLAEISYKKSGASAFTVLGMKKEGTAIEAAYEEMFEPVLTHEGGADTPFEEVISGQKFGFNLTVIDYTEQNLKDLTQVVDGTAGYEVGNNIGSLAPKYQVIIHFINDGADTSNDIYIPKCSLRIVNNINDTVNTPNELVIEAKAHWDDSVTPNILYKIGQNPA